MGITKNILRYIVILFILTITQLVYTQQIKIGVALPLFETAQDKSQGILGNEIYSGIKYALDTYNKKNKQKIQTVVMDTRRDPQATIQIFENFAADKNVVSVIGPVYSTLLGLVSGIGNENRLSIISPTATGDSLAELNPYVFQINPSYRVRGETMADYLINVLGKKNIAIIAENTYGVNFSQPFKSYTSKYGGKIVYEGYYDKKSQSIKPIIDSILNVIKQNDLFLNIASLNKEQHQKLMNAGVRWSLIDSLINLKMDVSVYYLFGKMGYKIADSLMLKPYKLKDHTKKYIQGYIDAVYIPVSNASEINVIVPALFSDGLNAFIAGTGDWNNEQVLSDNAVYIKELIFESESYPDGNERYTELEKNLKKTKYKINKNFLFGYDTAMLLLDLISQGYKTRELIYGALTNVQGYNGIKSGITINKSRINSELNILTYKNSIELVQRYRLEDK